MRGVKQAVLLFATTAFVVMCSVSAVSAARFSSSSYVIDASVVGNSMGGSQGSASYRLTGSGGESVVGNGAGGSYKVGMGYVAQLPKSLQLTVQPSGLVGYWPLDEASGSQVYDASSNGQALGSVTQPFSPGKINTALQFDASTAAISTTNSSALDFQSSDFTISFWYNPSTVTGNRDILRKGTLSGNGYEVALVGATPILYVSAVGNYRYCSAISANAWTQITFVKQSTGLTCYLNGVAANGSLGGSVPADIGTTAAQMTLGGTGFFGTGPAGLIDELKMFNIALPGSAVMAEYTSGSTGYAAGLSFATDIIPGVSQTSNFDAVVLTDASNYSLAINQNQNLTKGTDTIPAIPYTAASPSAWSEGTTKGLGFTLYGTNATAIDSKWSAGNSYAALPGMATTVYTRTNRQVSKDTLNMRLRLDVDSTQPSGDYANVIIMTGTILP